MKNQQGSWSSKTKKQFTRSLFTKQHRRINTLLNFTSFLPNIPVMFIIKKNMVLVPPEYNSCPTLVLYSAFEKDLEM